MLLKLIGFLSLICLLVFLPQAQSRRVRFVTPHRRHAHTHGQHHQAASSSQSSPLKSSQLHELPKPHIQMVTGSNEKHSQYADFGIAMVTVPHIHQVPDPLGAMLDTSVSGPNPGGNSQSLAASNGQNLLGDMLDTQVSGPNPGGNSESLLVSAPNLGGSLNTITSMLDTPVSGPSPSGNSKTLGNMLDTPVSGPNPGGNSQGLFVSGPNSRGSSAKGLASKLDNMLNYPVSVSSPRGNSATLGDMLDTPVSGPNPGENSQILSAVSGPNPGGNSQVLAASSGPNPGGNSEILAVSSGPNPGSNSQNLVSSHGYVLSGCKAGQFFATNVGQIEERDNDAKLSAVSGPNPGGNSATLGSNPSMSEKTEAGTLFDALPRTPGPPSGPSPIHNSADTNQGLFAVRSLRGSFIGCEQEGERDSGRFHHFEAYRRTIDDSNNMGAASLPSA